MAKYQVAVEFGLFAIRRANLYHNQVRKASIKININQEDIVMRKWLFTYFFALCAVLFMQQVYAATMKEAVYKGFLLGLWSEIKESKNQSIELTQEGAVTRLFNSYVNYLRRPNIGYWPHRNIGPVINHPMFGPKPLTPAEDAYYSSLRLAAPEGEQFAYCCYDLTSIFIVLLREAMPPMKLQAVNDVKIQVTPSSSKFRLVPVYYPPSPFNKDQLPAFFSHGVVEIVFSKDQGIIFDPTLGLAVKGDRNSFALNYLKPIPVMTSLSEPPKQEDAKINVIYAPSDVFTAKYVPQSGPLKAVLDINKKIDLQTITEVLKQYPSSDSKL